MNIENHLWQQANALLDELLDLDEVARKQRLQTIQHENPDLAGVLQQLLNADQASGLLDQGISQIAKNIIHDKQNNSEAAPPSVQAGEMIGPFHTIKPLGRGGMGEVYLAERREGDFVQQVAIKLLKRGMDSDDIQRRFIQERRILARLNHPHIARFLDGGVSSDNRLWYAMQYVHGLPITEFAQQQNLKLNQRIELLALVCDAVAYAHTQLIVHRDIKPSNILVDESAAPQVLDFGIAKLLDEDDNNQHTQTGHLLMSPAYAAPEQILGAAISTSTDVYALGVILFELLTGHLPNQRMGRTAQALALEVAKETSPKASQFLRQLHSGKIASLKTTLTANLINHDLDTIVSTALQHDPQRRYASASAMADDLRRWLKNLPIAAQKDSATYRMKKFVRRHRGGVAASLITMVALIGGFGVALWQAREANLQATRADTEAQRATLEADNAKQMAERATRVKDFLISIFLQEDPLRRDARGALTLEQAFDDTLKRIDSELKDDLGLQGDLLDDFGEIVTAKGNFELAQKLFERALHNAETTYGENDKAVAESLINLSVLASYRGDTAAGEPYLRRADKILEAQTPPDPVSISKVKAALGNVLRSQGNIKGALAVMQQALDAVNHLGDVFPERLQALGNLAVIHLDLGEYAAAEPLVLDVIAAIENAKGQQSSELIIPLSSLAIILNAQGRHIEEQKAIERQLALVAQTYPQDHPWKAATLADYGWFFVRQKNYAEGEKHIELAIAMHQRLHEQGHSIVGAWRRLGLSQHRRGDSNAALNSFKQGLKYCATEIANNDLICLVTRIGLNSIVAEHGEAERALAEIEPLSEILAEKFGTQTNEYAQALDAKANIFKQLNRYSEAVVVQQEAVVIYQHIYGADAESSKAAQAKLDQLKRLL